MQSRISAFVYVIWVLCEQGPAHGVMVVIDAMILSISLLSVLIVLEYQLHRPSIISVASTDHERLDIDTSLCSHAAGNKTICYDMCVMASPRSHVVSY